MTPPTGVPAENWRREHEAFLRRRDEERRQRARIAANRRARKARAHAERLARLTRGASQ